MSEETLYESEETRSRNGIATYLRRLARALGRGDPLPADEEQTVTVDPPMEPELAVEVERTGDKLSLDVEMEWVEEDGDLDIDAGGSKATFELYEDTAGQRRWRLVHDNGNIIADSGEGYASTQKAKQGLESVRTNAPGAAVVDQSKDDGSEDTESGSDAAFELFEDKGGKWRWRLVHDNGQIIADSGQGYASKQKAKQGLDSVKENVRGAPVELED
ncbi:HVO_2922 family protein [Halobellus marinus]|uniref:HVO_2922 family protein n=1 Tax=Halobellus TaxID=1073986 RepID=UPI0028A8EC52|nr:HVO_2922 family protein [Halobellus sp. DFY28]